MFSKAKNATIDLIKKTHLEKLKDFDAQKIIDKANQELSNLPLKIDEKLTEIKKILDGLVGNFIVDPTDVDIDLDTVVKQIEATIKPVVDSTSQLQSVGGKIPGLEQIGMMLKMVGSDNKPSTPLTKEQIKKLCPKPPSLPPDTMEKVKGIQMDIMQICSMFPMIYINLILKALDLIMGKLTIITKVIPLGGMFPLNVVPSALRSGSSVMKLMMSLSTNSYSLIKAVVMRKLQECAALAFPVPNINTKMLASLIEDIKENPPTKEVSTEVKKNYSKVSKDFWESTASQYGYTEFQVKEIQKNYKAINDASNLEIKTFKDDGKQELAATGDSLVGTMMSLAGMSSGETPGEGSGGNDKLGYKEDKDKRLEPSVEDYEKFLEENIKPDMESLSAITYPHLYKTEDLMGEYFNVLKDQLTSLGDEVVLYDKMKPAVKNSNSLSK